MPLCRPLAQLKSRPFCLCLCHHLAELSVFRTNQSCMVPTARVVTQRSILHVSCAGPRSTHTWLLNPLHWLLRPLRWHRHHWHRYPDKLLLEGGIWCHPFYSSTRSAVLALLNTLQTSVRPGRRSRYASCGNYLGRTWCSLEKLAWPEGRGKQN